MCASQQNEGHAIFNWINITTGIENFNRSNSILGLKFATAFIIIAIGFALLIRFLRSLHYFFMNCCFYLDLSLIN